MRLGELAGYIQETMESYEVEVDGKVLPGRCLFGVLLGLKLTTLHTQSNPLKILAAIPSIYTKYMAANQCRS